MITVYSTSSYTPNRKESPVKTTLTKNAKEQKMTLVVDWQNGRTGKHLSADEAENVIKLLEQRLQEAGREVFRQWLLQFESDADVIVVDGKTYRFKMVAEKEFLTKFGHITIPRRLYQQDTGGPTYIPLDEAWNMHGQFAAVDVRESLLFLSSLFRPVKSSPVSARLLPFRAARRTFRISSTKWAILSTNTRTN